MRDIRGVRPGIVGAVIVILSACGGGTPEIPAEPNDTGVPSDTPTLGGPCNVAGALGCAGHAQKLQLLCDGSKWVSNGVCADQKLCDPRPGPTLGSCQDPDSHCVGHAPGESFCDGAVRRTCGPDLLDSTNVTCASAEHCKQGTADKCAKCLDGSFVCEAAVLKTCAADRTGYVTKETCATDALCVDAYGKCLPPVCGVDEYRCDVDTLQKCRPSRNDWDAVKICPKGLCDASAKDCRECVPGSKDCAAGATPRLCDSTGHWTTLTPCSGVTPICKDGICAAGVCAAGEYRCTGDVLETCNSTLSAFDFVKTCASGLCDSIGKECDECKVGAAECVGTTPRACDSTGHWKSLTTCSGSTPYCIAGVCSACGPGLTSCGTACVDITKDPLNCGSCGTTCSAGSDCVSKTCVAVKKVVAGYDYTCERLGTGSLKCWGTNAYGQLGDGSVTNRSVPTAVTGITTAADIAVGSRTTCARLADGTVRCWGYGGNGQIGDGTGTDRYIPTAVVGLSGVAQMSVGGTHACALLTDGTVRCWGSNSYGQLGDGAGASKYAPPTTSIAGLSSVVEIDCGLYHSCARLSDGTMKCWGSNSDGQLGDGTTTNRSTPVLISLTNVTQISAGTVHTCATLGDGTAKCWGNNVAGQLGDYTTTSPRLLPTTVGGLTSVAHIGAGSNHSCALLTDGTAKCWGRNALGELGDGTITGKAWPQSVLSLTTGTQLSVGGGDHTCVRLSDDTAKCWGHNVRGQIGDGTTTDRTSPTSVVGF